MKTACQRLARWSVVVSAVALSACVDPSNLKGYQCDPNGANCVSPSPRG